MMLGLGEQQHQEQEQTGDVALKMAAILAIMLTMLSGLMSLQTPYPAPADSSSSSSGVVSSFLPCPKSQPSKYAYEMFCACYTPIWIFAFGIIVVFQLYEHFTATTYNTICLALALPFLLQPILLPSAGFHSPDQLRPLEKRYATKANIWLAIYSFIGNYWFTHYFYSVLKASYTMPSTRLNNVPIAMFFATHFYFSTYHTFSNAILRKIKTTFQPGRQRRMLYISSIVVLSYFTAFMETLTISSFPYYSFEDRDMAYTVGSAFYGICFLVSFPAFLEFDERIDDNHEKEDVVTIWDTIVQSCGYGMMILCLLDFVRLYFDIPLIVGGDFLP